MSDISETVDGILSRYSSEEALLEEELLLLQKKRLDILHGHQTWIPLKLDTLDDVLRTKDYALKRNKALRRDINISMGKLRSKKCYNPAEDNLNKMIEKYSEILSREDVD